MSQPPVQAPRHKFGRLPNDPTKARLRIRFNTAEVPDHPATADYAQVIDSMLKMLGNGPDPENAAAGVPADGAGDCVSVTWANDRLLTTANLTNAPTYPTLPQVVQFYKTQNPNFPDDDNGMVIQDALEYLRDHGGPDGIKAVAFAQVDHSDPDQLRAAVAIFGAVWLGVNVSAANEDEFDQGQPWDYVRRSQMLGGHCVPSVGYDATDIDFLTWAAETKLTDAFRKEQVEEAWVVIWPEMMEKREFLAGIDLDALAADYAELTDGTLPIPDPEPPTPDPTPTPDPDPTPTPDPDPTPTPDPDPTPTPDPDPTPTPDPGAAPFQGADPVVAAALASLSNLADKEVSDWLNDYFRTVFGLSADTEIDIVSTD